MTTKKYPLGADMDKKNTANTLADPPAEGQLIFNRVQVARMLGISATTLWRLMERGKIKYLRIGDRPYFELADIQEFIQAQKQRVTGGGR